MADTTEDKSAKEKTDAATETVPEEGRKTDETPQETDETVETSSDTDPETPDSDASTDGTVEEAGNDASIDGTVDEGAAPEQGVTPSGEPAPEEPLPAAEDTKTANGMVPVAAPAETKRSGGFVPMLLGGVIAAGLGYGAAYYGLTTGGPDEPDPFFAETRATLSDQSAELERLSAGADASRGDLDAIRSQVEGIDLSALEGGLTSVQSALSDIDSRISGLGDDMAAIDGRLTALEKRPVEEAVSPEAIAAYERELDALRGEVTAQKEALEAEKAALTKQIEAQTAEMERVLSEAQALEVSAEDQARLAENRAALADLTARVQDGRPFSEPVNILTTNGVSVPGALEATAGDGVPSIPTLAESYPDAARDALAAARKAPASDGEEGGGGLASFLTSQMGARSVVPKEGNSADAILSRAEAAIKGGDLQAALAELDALPEEAKAAMSDWIALARLRADALAGADTLAQQLNQQ
ncbi:COG4223 family protein [Sagittula stellata]|uniref:Mitochondrial inner membrane protein n=1 Tax=Sagittula stellata (strain ATCC 700073 / DSM 11524 / E-37) TaxID=388399 RepID=A3K8U2_SAGS3|nr:mitofilin family membrane protein [Sagittula stellata]EBA06325.1 hypothetical protein SSE37_17845 [Sagittula stellata E-37]